jgi:hypothetical protein
VCGWWRHKPQCGQFGCGLGRHNARQILGIGKEKEYCLDGDEYPLLELDVVGHPEQLGARAF